MNSEHSYHPRPGYSRDGAQEKNGTAGSGSGSGAAVTPLLDQAFDIDSLKLLRTAVADHAAAAGLEERRVCDVVGAVSELAANAIC